MQKMGVDPMDLSQPGGSGNGMSRDAILNVIAGDIGSGVAKAVANWAGRDMNVAGMIGSGAASQAYSATVKAGREEALKEELKARQVETTGQQDRKLADWFAKAAQARSSDTVRGPDDFTDDEKWAYQRIKGNGNSEEDAIRLAPLFAEVKNDQELQEALNFGGKSGPVLDQYRHRPTDPLAAVAYDKVLQQMKPLKGDAAYKDAYEASLLTVNAQAVDKVDAYIAKQGVDNVDRELLAQRNIMAASLIDKDVYYNNSVSEILPQSISRSRAPGLTVDDNAPGQSGYYAAVYEDKTTGMKFVANRGTEMGVLGHAKDDWETNGLQGLGLASTQFTMAMDFAARLRRKYGADQLIFTGHSLGGGLASAQAVVTGAQGITFNAAGLHANTVMRDYHVDLSKADTSKISAVYVKGEFLSMSQDSAVPGIKAGLINMPNALVKGAGWALTATGAGPSAVGNRIAIAPMTDSSWQIRYMGLDGSIVDTSRNSPFPRLGTPGVELQRYAAGVPMSAGLGNALDLHGESQVIFALQPRFAMLMRRYGIH
jgi:hypothetical protein